MNRAAVADANARLARAHPELVQDGRLRQLDPTSPADAALRKEWMDNYAAAGGRVAGGPSAADQPPPVPASAGPAQAAEAAAKVTPTGSSSCTLDQPPPLPGTAPPPIPRDALCRLTRLEVQRTGSAPFTIDGLAPNAPPELQLVGAVEPGFMKPDGDKGGLAGLTVEKPGFPQTAKPKVSLAGAGMCGPDHIHAELPTLSGSLSQGIGGAYSGEVKVAVREPAVSTFGDLFRLWRNPDYQGHAATLSGAACDRSGSVTVEAYPSGEFKGSIDPKKLWEYITFDGNIVGKVVGELMKEDLQALEGWRERLKGMLVPEFSINAVLGVQWRDKAGTPDVEVVTTSNLKVALTWKFEHKFASPYVWWPCPHRYYVKPGLEFEISGSGGQSATAPVNRLDALSRRFAWDASGELKLKVGGGVGVIHEVVLRGEAEVSGNFPIKVKPTSTEAPDAESRDVTIKFDKVALTVKVEALDGLFGKEKTYVLFENEGEPTTIFTVPDVLDAVAGRLGMT